MNKPLAAIGPNSSDRSLTDRSRRDVQRALGKADRRRLTDAIQEFAAYVDPTGEASTRPEMAYRNLTAMIYRPAGLNARQRKAKAVGENARDGMRHPVSSCERLVVSDGGVMQRWVVEGVIVPGAPEDAYPGAREDADGMGMIAPEGKSVTLRSPGRPSSPTSRTS